MSNGCFPQFSIEIQFWDLHGHSGTAEGSSPLGCCDMSLGKLSIFVDCLTQKMKAVSSFKMLETIYPVTILNVPTDMNF